MSKAKICQSPGCDRTVTAKGYCFPHYRRMKRGGNPDETLRAYGEMKGLPTTRVRAVVAQALETAAAVQKKSTYHLIQDILEGWYERHNADPRKPTD